LHRAAALVNVNFLVGYGTTTVNRGRGMGHTRGSAFVASWQQIDLLQAIMTKEHATAVFPLQEWRLTDRLRQPRLSGVLPLIAMTIESTEVDVHREPERRQAEAREAVRSVGKDQGTSFLLGPDLITIKLSGEETSRTFALIERVTAASETAARSV